LGLGGKISLATYAKTGEGRKCKQTVAAHHNARIGGHITEDSHLAVLIINQLREDGRAGTMLGQQSIGHYSVTVST